MTGPEFAAAHGSDSSTWTTADIEAELNLAEIDAYQARPLATIVPFPTPTTSPKGAA